MSWNRYQFDRIEDLGLLREFKRHYEGSVAERSRGRLDAQVDEAYLARARVTGMFDTDGVLVGGYVINVTAPLLLLSPLPDDVRVRWLARCAESDQCELVAIWKSPKISQAQAAASLWPRIIRDCARAGRHRILGLGYDNRMNDIYRVAHPTLVYAGPRADKPGQHQHVNIYAYTPLSITLTYVTNLVTELVIKPSRRTIARRHG